jgi:hypothetical protein
VHARRDFLQRNAANQFESQFQERHRARGARDDRLRGAGFSIPAGSSCWRRRSGHAF